MKKFLDLSSWRTALGNLLPSAHGHQGGSRKAAIGSMLIMAFAVVGCDDSSSASAGQNDEPAVESSSSSSGKAGEPAEGSSSSDKTSVSSSSSADELSSSSLVEISSCSEGEGTSSSSGQKIESSSSSASGINCSALLEGETGWSWDVPKECRFNPDIDYGSMTDSRDGKVYKTVEIGDLVWMAENLNYADSVTTTSLKGKSWCYNDVAANCDVAGRLYTWAAAIDSVALASDEENPLDCGDGKTCAMPDTVYGVCPPDWHLPTYAEWNALFKAVGGYRTASWALKTQSGWINRDSRTEGNGEDEFGFSALPAGSWSDVGSYYCDEGRNARFWSASEYGEDNAYFLGMNNVFSDASLSPTYKSHGNSVRCVKN